MMIPLIAFTISQMISATVTKVRIDEVILDIANASGAKITVDETKPISNKIETSIAESCAMIIPNAASGPTGICTAVENNCDIQETSNVTSDTLRIAISLIIESLMRLGPCDFIEGKGIGRV